MTSAHSGNGYATERGRRQEPNIKSFRLGDETTVLTLESKGEEISANLYLPPPKAGLSNIDTFNTIDRHYLQPIAYSIITRSGTNNAVKQLKIKKNPPPPNKTAELDGGLTRPFNTLCQLSSTFSCEPTTKASNLDTNR